MNCRGLRQCRAKLDSIWLAKSHRSRQAACGRKQAVNTSLKQTLEVRDIDYGKGPGQSMSVSWGDVSTAFYTTGIENITVYWPANDAMIRQIRFSRLLHPLLRLRPVQNFIKGRIEKKVEGPSREKRDQQQVHVWGEARNAAGKTISARITTANGYTVTQLAPVAIVEHLLQHQVTAGSTTPAILLGKTFASQLAGSSEIVLG